MAAKFKVALVKGGDSITIKNHGEFRGQVSFERYESLVKQYPQLADQFTILEGEVNENPETAEETLAKERKLNEE